MDVVGCAGSRWPPAVVAVLLCLLGAARPAFAVGLLTLDVRNVSGAGWSADGIELRLLPGGETGDIAASLRAERLVLPEPVGELRDVTLRCDSATVTAEVFRCSRGKAQAAQSPLDPRPFALTAEYRRADGRLRISSPDLPWQDLSLRVSAELGDAGWTAAIEGSGLDAATAYASLSAAGVPLPALAIAGGAADLSLRVTGDEGSPSRLDAKLNLRDVSLANDSGSLAAEGLTLALETRADIAASGERIDYSATLSADAGEAYLEPAYLDISAAPLRVESVGSVDLAGGSARLDSFRFDHREVLAASGDASLVRTDEGLSVRQAAVEITEAVLPGVYTTYLQGFLTGTPLAKLETRGRTAGRVTLEDGRLTSLDLRLDDLYADDAEERLAIYGARGDVAWTAREGSPARSSTLRWDGGFVYRIGFGSGSAAFTSTPDRVALADPLRVPVLDGALVIDTLEARGLSGEEPSIEFDARLEPVSLAGITTAIGWPALPGKLSGELPLLSVSEGAVTLGGSLVARVFDGTARISELRIEQPFGTGRRTSADVTLDNLDLALVTDVFTFGRITGRLDGAIRDLEMLQGRPIAFDASFYTPADDDSPHRISRRALSNISEIAGSGTAALSAGFLGLFEEFRYDSLGIRCVLEGDVCRMSGVKPAQQGYYLVKGSGLPRIDVIGHSREVNWPRLVAQITEALRSREVSTAPQSEERR